MIQGMTGFAEKNFASSSLRLKISIKSLNHRFFDWSYRGTPLGDVENRIRGLCQQKLQRGRIEVFLEMTLLDPKGWNFSVNEALLEKVVKSLEKVSARMKKPFDPSLDQILRIPQIIDLSRNELTAAQIAFIEKAFRDVLDEVVQQRIQEGRQTVRRLDAHIRKISVDVARIEKLFARQPAMIKRKLRQRFLDTNHGTKVPEDRLAEETSYLVQRYDLAEEILRLKSHLETLRDLIAPGAAGPVGKKLDFLSQEIFREANTASSKSQDIELINSCLSVKNELESIRQHVQNIE